MDPSHDGFSSAYAIKTEKVDAIRRSHSAEKIYSPSVQITIAVKRSEQPGVAVGWW